ncbi:MAG: DUF1848 family protein [Bacteroidota bacterium]
MSLFDQQPFLPSTPIVLSASRMTDMVAYYPGEIIHETLLRIEKRKLIHTLVLWTKHPAGLFKEPLYSFLEKLKNSDTQIALQLTITGMGKMKMGKNIYGKDFIPEPGVSSCKETLSLLPRLVEFLGHPGRINLRIDPLLRIKDAEGNIFSNKNKFTEIIGTAVENEIRNITFSFVEKDVYKKVNRRFENQGIEIFPPSALEREEIKKWLNSLCKEKDVKVKACCVEGFTSTRCIDGEQLTRLHDKKWPVTMKQPKSRPACGCTASIDIGGWPPKKCYSGCIYCYSNPSL